MSSTIQHRHDPRPTEHSIRLITSDSDFPILEAKWLGDEDACALVAVDDTIELRHEDIEKFFEAYLTSRGYVVTKNAERAIADKRRAADEIRARFSTED